METVDYCHKGWISCWLAKNKNSFTDAKNMSLLYSVWCCRDEIYSRDPARRVDEQMECLEWKQEKCWNIFSQFDPIAKLHSVTCDSCINLLGWNLMYRTGASGRERDRRKRLTWLHRSSADPYWHNLLHAVVLILAVLTHSSNSHPKS